MNTFFILRRFTQIAYRIRGVGLGRLCEAIRLWSSRYAPSEPLLIQNFRGRAKFWCYLQEHMSSQIFFRGAYSGDQLDLLEQILPQNGVFVDVGANQGEFTVASAAIMPEGKVLVFEPVTENLDRLRANVEINRSSNVLIFPVVLGDRDGEVEMYDSCSQFDDGTIHSGLATAFQSGRQDRSIGKFRVRRLDDVLRENSINRLDVMKIDVEGAEWPVLRGATETLKKFKPTLICEVNRETCHAANYEPEEFVRWLISLGYHLFLIGLKGKTYPLLIDELKDFQNIVAFPEVGR